MYITNYDYNTICKALLVFTHDWVEDVPSSDVMAINEAINVMEKLSEKKKANNARQAAYIAEKRKTNKNYAR